MTLTRRLELYCKILSAHDRDLITDQQLYILLATAWIEGADISAESEQSILTAAGENT